MELGFGGFFLILKVAKSIPGWPHRSIFHAGSAQKILWCLPREGLKEAPVQGGANPIPYQKKRLEPTPQIIWTQINPVFCKPERFWARSGCRRAEGNMVSSGRCVFILQYKILEWWGAAGKATQTLPFRFYRNKLPQKSPNNIDKAPQSCSRAGFPSHWCKQRFFTKVKSPWSCSALPLTVHT